MLFGPLESSSVFTYFVGNKSKYSMKKEVHEIMHVQTFPIHVFVGVFVNEILIQCLSLSTCMFSLGLEFVIDVS